MPAFSRVYVEYHQNVLVKPARTRGFGLDNGRTLADLEILAKLQHFGAATGLLDFTYSPLIALWFACQKEKCDGKVFSINTTDPLAFGKISHQMVMEEGVSKLLSPDTDTGSSLPWIWEPIATGDAETRVLIQHSLFVVGRPSIAKGVAREITIKKADKEQIRKELDTIYAIREESLFKDVYGFASVNRASYPIPAFEGPELYFLFGNRKYQERDYQGAIDDYGQAIRLKPDFAEAYGNRGNVKSRLNRYEDAIADYDQVLHHQPDYAEAYVNRGAAKNDLGRYEEAIADYDQALRLQPDLAEAYSNRGTAWSDLGRHDEAITDCDQAIRLRPDYAPAYSNRGIAKSYLGRHEDAVADYDQAIHLQPDLAEGHVNRGEAKAALGRVAEARRDYERALALAQTAGNDGHIAYIEQQIQELDSTEQE